MVMVNGRETLVFVDETVAGLLTQLGMGVRGSAVALNGELLPRALWPSTRLNAADALEVLAPAAGG